jgi:hypothetical protein
MFLTDITLDHVPQIEAIVRRLATESPDEVRNCTYVDDCTAPTEPHCIVGCALFELGVPLHQLAEHDGMAIYELPFAFNGLDDDGRTVTALSWLERVQAKQDLRWSWGEALAAAQRTVQA